MHAAASRGGGEQQCHRPQQRPLVALPWDLARLRPPSSCPVIMVRLSCESTPGRFRWVQGRRKLVIHPQAGWSASGTEGLLDRGFNRSREGVPRAFVIEGSGVYAMALPFRGRA